MTRKKAKPIASDTPGASMIEGFEADAAALLDGKAGKKAAALAFGYWIGYPAMIEAVECAKWPGAAKAAARRALDYAHHAATRLLMKEAAQRGLNPHGLYACHRVTVEVYRDEPGRAFRRGIADTWPEGMGAWRYELPAGQQEALREGEAVFTRLAVALDVQPAKPHIPNDEREIRIRKYLAANPEATRDSTAAALGISGGAVSKSAAWQAEADRRKKKKGGRRARAIAHNGIVKDAAATGHPDVLSEVIEREEEAERQAEIERLWADQAQDAKAYKMHP